TRLSRQRVAKVFHNVHNSMLWVNQFVGRRSNWSPMIQISATASPSSSVSGRAVIHADDRRGIRNDDRIPALLGRNLQPALDCGDGHDAVRQFFCHRGSIDRAWIRHADGHIDEHVAGSLAKHPEETKARVTYGIRDGAL